MASDPQATYRAPPAAGNSREIQAWALTEAAVRMKNARDAEDLDALLAAVRKNWQLWTLFQAELLGPECTVPEPVRGNLVALAAFIDRHTVAFLSDHAFDKIEILISINRELAMGLYTVPAEDAPVAEAAPAAAMPVNLSA